MEFEYKIGDIILTNRNGNPIIYKILKLDVTTDFHDKEFYSRGTHKCLIMLDESDFWGNGVIRYWSHGSELRDKERRLSEDEVMVWMI